MLLPSTVTLSSRCKAQAQFQRQRRIVSRSRNVLPRIVAKASETLEAGVQDAATSELKDRLLKLAAVVKVGRSDLPRERGYHRPTR
ncbi:hypothetical protein CYMTET_46173 [Cymbomonas tetramitiformis]|uniref:Uncharacterized protein n=1 Tax=Cymbomonas tetramitiformis TaxID=36881 RepID=A0AAE0EXV3_9CHLO|nr:hypothetical protein CYMTET_46173 [Cymbomonas tetramitiformis]